MILECHIYLSVRLVRHSDQHCAIWGVRITTLPAREVAVIRFKGYASRQEVDETMSLLQEGLKKSALAAVGQPFLMRYNPPWTPGFLRRNEVGVEIRR